MGLRDKMILLGMKRVIGIGGVFFKSEDPARTKKWYSDHLGIPDGPYGHAFVWQTESGHPGTTTWSVFSQGSNYFGDGGQPFMVNYRVAELATLLEALRAEGVKVLGEMQEFEYGKFAWVEDCDGRRVELWEPVDEPLIES